MSVPQESLSDILSDKVIDDDAPSPTGDTTDKVDTAPPADGKDKVDDKSATDKAVTTDKTPPAKEEPKPEVKADKPRGELAALLDERRRRQAAEERLRIVEGGKDKAAKPSVLDDEDKAFDTRIDEGTRGLREQNYHLSVKLARMEHREDFAAAEEAFAEAADKDDRLIAALRASSDPGEYIYSVGMQIKELASVGGDFVQYREKVTAESRAKISDLEIRNKALEAQVAELTKQKTDLETLPRSLNSRPSGASPKEGDEDDEDIGSIVRFGKNSR